MTRIARFTFDVGVSSGSGRYVASADAVGPESGYEFKAALGQLVGERVAQIVADEAR